MLSGQLQMLSLVVDEISSKEETKELWQMLTWSLFHVGFGSSSTSEANFACWSRSRIMNLE
jgi:hypothetical protein